MSRTGITLLSPGQREISPSGPPRGAGEESADHERPRYHRRRRRCPRNVPPRSEEHTSELQSLMRISYAVFCLKKKIQTLHIYYMALDYLKTQINSIFHGTNTD